MNNPSPQLQKRPSSGSGASAALHFLLPFLLRLSLSMPSPSHFVQSSLFLSLCSQLGVYLGGATGWDEVFSTLGGLQKSSTEVPPLPISPALRTSCFHTAWPMLFSVVGKLLMISVYSVCEVSAHCGFDLDFPSDQGTGNLSVCLHLNTLVGMSVHICCPF